MIDDPRSSQPQPPFEGEQRQPRPGLTSKMHPKPDHGEESYRGKGLLAGKVALITGGDSGIGRAHGLVEAAAGSVVEVVGLALDPRQGLGEVADATGDGPTNLSSGTAS